jgi:hypothetical protein
MTDYGLRITSPETNGKRPDYDKQDKALSDIGFFQWWHAPLGFLHELRGIYRCYYSDLTIEQVSQQIRTALGRLQFRVQFEVFAISRLVLGEVNPTAPPVWTSIASLPFDTDTAYGNRAELSRPTMEMAKPRSTDLHCQDAAVAEQGLHASDLLHH